MTHELCTIMVTLLTLLSRVLHRQGKIVWTGLGTAHITEEDQRSQAHRQTGMTHEMNTIMETLLTLLSRLLHRQGKTAQAQNMEMGSFGVA